ncbi:MAG TPA: hypothetical protein VEB63_08260 [Chitinophagaceae bacterium]|nr:hypothetical protein [Chitinophagaceae bacterium]
MENYSAAGSQGAIPLRSMVNRVSEHLAAKGRIVNQIPSRIPVGCDREKFSAVLFHLFCTLVQNLRETEFRVSAKTYSSVTLLHIKGSAEICENWFRERMQPVVQLAESLGGTIELTSFHNRISTIAFSFVNAA